MVVAVIGGTGIDEMQGIASGRRSVVSTAFGDTTVVDGEIGGKAVVFVPRHGPTHSVPPALINSRSQIAALKMIGVESVIGVSAVGSLTAALQPGSLAVLGDFIDLTRRRERTFFDRPTGPVVHTDLSRPYCPRVSGVLARACEAATSDFKTDAVYLGVDGPRYETPAEVRLYASWGAHVIGMTNVPEVVLAREAGLCYGAVAVITNLASGLSPTPLNHDEVRAAVLSAAASLRAVLEASISLLPGETGCDCAANSSLQV